jgi:hypothetical protein
VERPTPDGRVTFHFKEAVTNQKGLATTITYSFADIKHWGPPSGNLDLHFVLVHTNNGELFYYNVDNITRIDVASNSAKVANDLFIWRTMQRED